MLVNERKDPYRIRIPVVWDERDEIKRRLMKLESNSLVKTIREEMTKYSIVVVLVEKHD